MLQHYTGGCQCGAVRYEVDVDLASTVTCNCSRCQRLGSVLAFTSEDKFKLLQGEEQLTEYLFNKGVIHHFFCKVCGIESLLAAPHRIRIKCFLQSTSIASMVLNRGN